MESQIIWTPGMTLDALEKQVILTAYRFYRANKTATSAALGIAVRTLDNKLEKYKEDGHHETKRVDDERAKRAEWLAKSRGERTPDNVNNLLSAPTAETKRHETYAPPAGVRVEPAHGTTSKHDVPMSERPKVQTVLPAQTAPSGARRGR